MKCVIFRKINEIVDLSKIRTETENMKSSTGLERVLNLQRMLFVLRLVTNFCTLCVKISTIKIYKRTSYNFNFLISSDLKSIRKLSACRTSAGVRRHVRDPEC